MASTGGDQVADADAEGADGDAEGADGDAEGEDDSDGDHQ